MRQWLAIASAMPQRVSTGAFYARMARYQAVIEYDGTDFVGFQRQADDRRTVQGTFEATLRRLKWTGRSILGAGRTDTGVHASGQVVAFDFAEWRHTPAEMLRALNAHLPEDLAVKQLAACDPKFHPRYAARGRCYRYSIYQQPGRSPLASRYAWQLWPPLNFEALCAASALLVGRHDFAAFGTDPDDGHNTIRTVQVAEWQPVADWLYFDIQAEAFLFRMVRSIVGALKQVGMGQMPVPDFAALLASRDRNRCPKVAPPHGLCLTTVLYT